MPHSRSTAQPAPSRGAALVSVDGRVYPLTRASITARARGGLAISTLTQEFRNPFDEPLEVLYTLPLPADGAVLGYVVRIGDRVIRGEIEKRAKAKVDYEKAILEGRTAALLDQERDDTFTQRLGAIPPGPSVLVEIEVLHPLDFSPAGSLEPGQWEYRFPTVAGVRYEGAPERVADADLLDVDRAREGDIPTRIELDLAIGDGPPAALAVVSSTHDIVCGGEADATRVTSRFGARLDRDVVIRWTACSQRTGVRIVEGTGRPGDDGRYALLTLTPPAVAEAAFERDVTIVLDASGSMSGWPLEWAKTVVRDLILGLTPGDRFEILAFASETVRLTPGLVAARQRDVERALARLDALSAGGGTEMANAVTEALKPFRSDAQRQVVLVTDGQVGFEREVTGKILKTLPANSRVHAVGVGSAPNRTLTRGVARAGRGIEMFATDETSAAAAGERLCRATARPVLTELSIGGDALVRTAPERPRDVLAGAPMIMTVELKPEGGTVEVKGRQAGSRDVWIWRVAVPARATSGVSSHGDAAVTTLPLGALHGRELIADLEMESAAGMKPAQQIDSHIEAAGLRHRIVSRMTSLVAIAEEPSVDPGLPLRRERLAVELPAFVSADGCGLTIGAFGARYLLEGPLTMAAMPLDLRMLKDKRSIASRLAAVRPAPSGSGSPFPGQDIEISAARVVRSIGDQLVIEFEAPFDGFVLPNDDVNVWLDGVTWHVARIVPKDGFPQGPYPAGTVIVMPLRLDRRLDWNRYRSVEVRWPSEPDGASDGSARRQITLRISLGMHATST